MVNLSQQLAACADTSAVIAELGALVTSLTCFQDREKAINDIVAILTTSEERWTSVVMTLLSDLSKDSLEREVQLVLLDGLLSWMTPDKMHLNHKVMQILLQYLRIATTNLGNDEGGKRWLKWGNKVLALVHHNASFIANLDPSKDGSKTEKESLGWTDCIVNIVLMLMELHNKLEERDDGPPDLKVETFVWKNVAKLATAFGPILTTSCSSNEAAKENDKEEHGAERFNVDEILGAVVTSVERSAGQMLCNLNSHTTTPPDIGVLKFFKLYWRAFLRLISSLVENLQYELENCVLALVNVTATLLYVERHNLVPFNAKQDLRSMLDQALELAEMLADGTVYDKSPDSISKLLWYPADDMVRAVGQRQPIETFKNNIEKTTRWGHLLLLTAFAGSMTKQLSSIAQSEKPPNNNLKKAVEVAKLFARYRECALIDETSSSVEPLKMFTDLILQYFLSFEDIVELQLLLLKQTLYPDWMQRTLCWDIWRELLCFCWDETLSAHTLQMLLKLTQWDIDNVDTSFILASGVEEEVLQLIAFVYSDLPKSLKDMCMDRVTSVIDLISTEGPGHHFDLRMASKLQLLEKLVAVHFLEEYNGQQKNEWIAKYLPVCFECCGTILELMSSKKSSYTTRRESLFGMMRVLDLCLLVLRAVMDDNGLDQNDIEELSVIVARIATEALSQLAKHSQLAISHLLCAQIGNHRSSRKTKLEKAEAHSFERALESSLYLLSKLGSIIKANRKNQCVQLLKDLLIIVENTHNSPDAVSRRFLFNIAQFVDSVLFDMQVASGDMPVVWQLLLSLFQSLICVQRTAGCHIPNSALLQSVAFAAVYKLLTHSNIVELVDASPSALFLGDSRQSFIEYVEMRKLNSEGIIKFMKKASLSSLQSLKNCQDSLFDSFRDRFPDESNGSRDESSRNNVLASKRSVDDQLEGLPEKRRKLTHFVALCQEIESSISSMNDEAAVTILSGDEIENATVILDRLLSKISTQVS
ncbi:hypothetical protein Plhal703r1_c01g0002031 [Plasmopara halstedii]